MRTEITGLHAYAIDGRHGDVIAGFDRPFLRTHQHLERTGGSHVRLVLHRRTGNRQRQMVWVNRDAVHLGQIFVGGRRHPLGILVDQLHDSAVLQRRIRRVAGYAGLAGGLLDLAVFRGRSQAGRWAQTEQHGSCDDKRGFLDKAAESFHRYTPPPLTLVTTTIRPVSTSPTCSTRLTFFCLKLYALRKKYTAYAMHQQ